MMVTQRQVKQKHLAYQSLAKGKMLFTISHREWHHITTPCNK